MKRPVSFPLCLPTRPSSVAALDLAIFRYGPERQDAAPSPPGRSNFTRAGKLFLLAESLFLGLSLHAGANTTATVNSNATDLTAAASFSSNPTLPTSTYDILFSSSKTYGGAFTLNLSESYGTLDDLSATALTIDNTSGTADVLTLNPGTNSTSGARSSDLIYVASGSSLSIGTANTNLSLSLSNTGNFDNAGTLNVGSAVSIVGSKFLTFTGAGTTTVSGAISSTSSGGVIVNAVGGTVNLSGANTYSAATTVNAGTLNLTGSLSASNVIVNGGGTFSESTTGSIGTSSQTFTVNGGAATLAAASTNNTYHGGTTVEGGGTLTVSGSVSSQPLVLGNSAFGGGTFNFSNPGSGFIQSFSGTTLSAGASSVNSTVSGDSLRLTAITRSVGSTVDFTTTTGPVTTTNANPSGGILGGYATYAGETTWAVSGAGASTAITGLSSGSYTSNTWAAGNNTNAGSSGFSPAASSTTNSLRFSATGAATYAVSLTGTNVITTGGILETSAVGSSATVIGGSGTLAGAAGADLVVIQNNTGNSMTISAGIANNTSATGLTKSGAGTLALSGADTYTGATTVNTGSLLVGTGGSINNTSSVTVYGGATFGAATGTAPVTIGTSSIPLNLNLGATTASQSNLQFNIYSSSGADSITVGALTLTAPSAGTGTVAVNVNDASNGTLAGPYTLLTWTGSSFPVSDFTLAGSALSEGSLSVSGDTLVFTVTSVPEPSVWALLPLAAGLAVSRSRIKRFLIGLRKGVEC